MKSIINFIIYTFVLLLKYLSQGLTWIFLFIGKIFYYIFLPIKFLINNILLQKIIFPIYKLYLNFHNVLQNVGKTLNQWIFAPLTTRYAIHITLIIISFGVITSNIYAQELENQITPVEGKNGILISLITLPENELIEESANYNHFDAVFDYPLHENPYLVSTDYASNIEVNYLKTVDNKTLAKPTITTTTTNLKLRNTVEKYTIQSGDTLSGIATKFGLNINTLLNTNNLSLRSSIKPGQTLTILPVDGLLYTIKNGDTISKLASTYQAQTNQIKDFNNLQNNTLSVGEEIIIPYGVKPKPVYTPPPTVTYSQPSSTPTPQPATNSGNNSGVREKVAYGNAAPATSAVYAPEYAPNWATPSNTPLQWPTSDYVITQYYHYGHPGLDISGSGRYNAPLYAAESGTVITAQGGYNYGYGVYVKIDHGNGLQTLYAHASQLFVKPGDYVERGQPVAMMGTTGRSTGPHIHFEVRKNGTKVNPLNYIR